MFIFRNYTFLVLLLIFIACGKKTNDSSGSSDQGPRDDQENPTDTRLESVIKDQRLECDDLYECPGNLTKIVITGQKFLTQCTGILIKEDEVLTSATCLPKNLRVKDINCAESAFFVFPQTAQYDQEIRLCDKVIYADVNVFDQTPEIWKNDMAIIKLSQPIKRAISKIHKEGIDPGSYRLWKVDVQTDKLAYLKKDECQILNKTYLNPYSDNAYSGMFVSSGCSLDGGNVGAALLNTENKIVGVYSKEMSEVIYAYLQNSNVLSEELDRYYHFSNTSCMPYDPNSDILGTVSKMCSRIVTTSMLDKVRASMLRNKNVHQEAMQKLEEDLEKPNKYFEWDIKFFAANSGRSFEVHLGRPKCIYRKKDWIDEFSKVRRRRRIIQTSATISIESPQYIFYTKLNRELQPVSVLAQDQMKKYAITFNPYTAYVNDKTDVLIEGTLNGRDQSQVYQDITDNCNQ